MTKIADHIKAATGQTSFQRYAATGEQKTARRLVRAALERGYQISVNDGEETTVIRASAERPVLDALCSTGEDTLILYRPNGADELSRVGSLFLVWGNADDGSELIADHTDNEAIGELYAITYPDA